MAADGEVFGVAVGGSPCEGILLADGEAFGSTGGVLGCRRGDAAGLTGGDGGEVLPGSGGGWGGAELAEAVVKGAGGVDEAGEEVLWKTGEEGGCPAGVGAEEVLSETGSDGGCITAAGGLAGPRGGVTLAEGGAVGSTVGVADPVGLTGGGGDEGEVLPETGGGLTGLGGGIELAEVWVVKGVGETLSRSGEKGGCPTGVGLLLLVGMAGGVSDSEGGLS